MPFFIGVSDALTEDRCCTAFQFIVQYIGKRGFMATKKKTGKTGKTNKWLLLGAIYLGLILLCVLIVYIVPSVRGMLVRTYITEQGEIRLTDEVTAYVVRDEEVYTAKVAGKVNRLGEEGKLVKAGTRVVEISGAGLESSNTTYIEVLDHLGKKIRPTEAGVSKIAGYVCYSIDGAEGRLRKSNVMKLKKETIEELGSYSSVKTAGGQCAAGNPVFKVVKNGKFYVVFYLDTKAADRYCEGQSVMIRLGDRDYDARVKAISKTKTRCKILLSCGYTYDGFLTDRKIDTTVTTASAKGLMLEDKSIIEKDGKKGVLVKNKVGNYVFKEICVKADDGEKCVVYQDIFMDENSNFVETLSIYDEIVASPSEEDIKAAQ